MLLKKLFNGSICFNKGDHIFIWLINIHHFNFINTICIDDIIANEMSNIYPKELLLFFDVIIIIIE
jgi:hypothetical protein